MSTATEQPNHPNKPSLREKVLFLLNEKWITLKFRWAAFAKNKSKTGIFFRFAAFSFGSILLLSLLLVLAVRLGAFGKIPDKQTLRNIQNDNAAQVFSADGVLLGKYYIQNRVIVPLEQISPDLLNALIATEDARFFQHQGVDIRALLRVLLRTVLLRDDSGGGGSTISQQLAKNLFPRPRNAGRFTILTTKIKEMFTARRLEKIYSKNELLGLYLNTVPFGSDIYGVEVAAKQFFNTSAKNLKTEQAAVLIGMLKANTYYNPVRNPNNAKKRRDVVLHQMMKYKYLDKAAVDSLTHIPLKVDYSPEKHYEGQATYFREHLRQKLKDILKLFKKDDASDYNLYTDGLKIYTTIDSRMQAYAEKAVSIHLKNLQKSFDQHWKGKKPWGDDAVLIREMKKSNRYIKLKEQGLNDEAIRKAFDQPYLMTIFTWEGEQIKQITPMDSIKHYYSMLNAGFLVMNPHTGDIQAWVGGSNFKYFQYDHVKATRQVGSIFKPIVYAKALQNGYFPCDYFHNRLVTYSEYDDWTPHNSDNHYGGLYSMAGALSNSVNAVAVDLIMRSGVEEVKELARQMGIVHPIPDAPSIALGTADLSLYEMIQVYATFANRGKHIAPRYITKIEKADGSLLVEFKANAPKEVLQKDRADVMVKMLEMVVDSGTARRLRYLYKFQNDIAGKTGTTQSQSDGWFIGFTPNIVAGAWVGGEYPQVRFRSIRLGQGANTALPIWAIFMKELFKDKKFRHLQNASFPEPDYALVESMNCPPYVKDETALLVEDEAEGINKKIDVFLEGLRGLKKQKDQTNKSPEELKKEKQRNARHKRSEEIRRRNERLKKKKQRKKKRKKFWDKIFKNN